jgi:hypothetical protein
MSFRHLPVTELFESVRVGIALAKGVRYEYRKTLFGRESHYPVLPLRLSSFSKEDGVGLDWALLEKEMANEDPEAAVQVIEEDRLLQPGDYLISHRGPLRGFSMTDMLSADMPQYLSDMGLRLVAGNNFIVMRARNLRDNETAFAHMMLDSFIAGWGRDLPANLRQDADEDRTETARFEGVKELRKLTFSIPLKASDQKAIVGRYRQLLTEHRKAAKSLSGFRDRLQELLNPQLD